MEPIYLDHAATTPIHPLVIQSMTEVMNSTYGNPSSIHGFGRQARRKLEDMRQLIATNLQVKPHEIIFNSGGTESDNTALIETAQARSKYGRHILTTTIEHPAVLETMRYLETLDFDVTYLPVDSNGMLAVSAIEAALREDTILVSVMFANNELGTLFPIKEIGQLLKEHQAIFHTDAVQAFGSEHLSPHDLGVDLLSISAHKINGPKGVGFLFKSDKTFLPPLLHGGNQEEKRRAGTENLPGIVGMSKAVELLTNKERELAHERYNHYQKVLLNKLNQAKIDYHLNGSQTQKVVHIINIWFKNVSSELLLMHLDLQGIAISTGSACTAGTIKPSHVLQALYGKNHQAVSESVRISFGINNSRDQIDRFSSILVDTIHKLRKS